MIVRCGQVSNTPQQPLFSVHNPLFKCRLFKSKTTKLNVLDLGLKGRFEKERRMEILFKTKILSLCIYIHRIYYY